MFWGHPTEQQSRCVYKMWTTIVLAVLLISSAVFAQKKCCVDRQFTAILSDTGEIAKGNYQYSLLAEDFDAKLLSTTVYKFSPGNSSTLIARTVQDFNEAKQYVIYGNNCDVTDLSYSMEGPCTPDDAEFLGSNYMGYAPNRINVTGYRWKFSNQNAHIVMSFSDDCVPLVESITGNVNGADVDFTYTFTMYDKSIPDRSVFNIPASCKSS